MQYNAMPPCGSLKESPEVVDDLSWRCRPESALLVQTLHAPRGGGIAGTAGCSRRLVLPMRLAPEELDAGYVHLVSVGAGVGLDVGDVFVGTSAGVA